MITSQEVRTLANALRQHADAMRVRAKYLRQSRRRNSWRKRGEDLDKAHMMLSNYAKLIDDLNEDEKH